MIDHLLKFETEAAAKAALPAYVIDDQWDGSRTIPGLSIITTEAVWDMTDPEAPVLVTPEQRLPGWWIAIGLTELSATLRDLPGNACRLITSREAAAAGQPFVLYAAPDADPQIIATATVSPVFSGSSYMVGVE